MNFSNKVLEILYVSFDYSCVITCDVRLIWVRYVFRWGNFGLDLDKVFVQVDLGLDKIGWFDWAIEFVQVGLSLDKSGWLDWGNNLDRLMTLSESEWDSDTLGWVSFAKDTLLELDNEFTRGFLCDVDSTFSPERRVEFVCSAEYLISGTDTVDGDLDLFWVVEGVSRPVDLRWQ